MVEQRPFKPLVASSSLAQPTIFFSRSSKRNQSRYFLVMVVIAPGITGLMRGYPLAGWVLVFPGPDRTGHNRFQ